MEVAPAVMKLWEERFGVDRALRRRTICNREQRDRAGLRCRGRRDRADCWKDIAELNRCGDRFSTLALLRKLEHQRNLQSFAIDKDAVLRFAVVVESFAV